VTLHSYVRGLKPGKVVLWCYLLWYLVLAAIYFDPSPGIWLNALGISGVIGVALWLGVRVPGQAIERWQILRLFLTPFCVSSFSALIKGKGFVLIFPPRQAELLAAAGVCALFVAVVAVVQRYAPGTGAHASAE
jgi:hypothetical protein